MPTNLSPNMSLPVPVVGQEPGPQWASDINNCLILIDMHNHATGAGVPIMPSGININSDLTFNSNNATSLRSVRFTAQNSTLSGGSDLGCVYVSGVDLYFNDENGNKIQLTKNGSVAGTSGSIANLVSPASASFNSGPGTFVFQSGANIPGNMDVASLIIRDQTAGSNGITINAPASLASNYSVTFPASLPGAQSFVTLDNSGNIAAPSAFAQGITRSNLAAVGQQITSSINFTTGSTSGAYVSVTGSSLSLTTSGRPVFLAICSDGNNSSVFSGGDIRTGADAQNISIGIFRGSTLVASQTLNVAVGYYWLPGFMGLDVIGAGTYTYSIKVASNSSTLQLVDCVLLAYEL